MKRAGSFSARVQHARLENLTRHGRLRAETFFRNLFDAGKSFRRETSRRPARLNRI